MGEHSRLSRFFLADAGHHEFIDKQTGKKIRFDKGKPGEFGHKGHDHYQRHNPTHTGDHDMYLDAKGNPVPKGHDKSHLYPPGKA